MRNMSETVLKNLGEIRNKQRKKSIIFYKIKTMYYLSQERQTFEMLF